MEQAPRRVVVVGGGIAGLAAAYYLRKRGAAVEVVEREDATGGMLRSSLREERYIVELGPVAFPAAQDAVAALARELALHGLVVGDAHAPVDRYVLHRGRPVVVPRGGFAMLRSPLLPIAAKLRRMVPAFVRGRGDDAASLDAVAQGCGIPAEAMADPFASFAWAGDACELESASIVQASAGEAGARRSALPGLLSFKWGMGTLAARLEETLRGSIRTGLACTAIERRKAGGFTVALGHGRKNLQADAVIVAAPAHAAAHLLTPFDAALAAPFAAIPYAPIASVHASYSTKDIPRPLCGGGFVVPRSEGLRLLAAVFTSSLFPGRCPSSEQLITSYLGGALDPSAVELTDEELGALAAEGMRTALGIAAAPRFTYIKRWVAAIPQFTLGHAQRVAEIAQHLEVQPGLFATGSYLADATVGGTIAHARETANSTAAYLKTL